MPDDGPPYACATCNRNFASYGGLTSHKYRSPRHFFCQRCDLDFPSVADLSEHLDAPVAILLSLQSGFREVQCSCCKTKYTGITHLKDHAARSQNHKNSCPSCLFDFHTVEALQRHVQQTHAPVIAPPVTPDPLPVQEVLEPLPVPRVETAATPATPAHFCRRCRLGFETLVELREHLDLPIPVFDNLGSDEGRVRCMTCRATYPNKNQFMKHLRWGDLRDRRTHAFTCILCLLDFHNLYGLRKHRMHVHPLPSPSQGHASAAVTPPNSLDAELELPPTAAPASRPPAVSDASPDISRSVSVEQSIPSVNPPSPRPLPRRPTFPLGVPPKYCSQCQITFETFAEQEQHVTKALPILSTEDTENEDGFRCGKCKTRFTDMNALRSHLRSGLPAHETTCADCLVHFHSARGLREHNESIHESANHPPAAHGGDGPGALAPSSAPITSTPTPPSLPPSQPLPPPSPRPTPPRPRSSQAPVAHVSRRGQNRQRQAVTTQRNSNPVRRLDPPSLRQISTADFTESEASESGETDHTDPWQLRNDLPPRHAHGRQNSYAGRTGRNAGRTPLRRGHQDPAERFLWTNADVDLLPTLESRSPLDPPPVVVMGRRKTSPPLVTLSDQGTKLAPRVSALAVSCPLCLENAVNLTSTPCGHVGCGDCLIQSIKVKPECPLCRHPATLSQLHPLFL